MKAIMISIKPEYSCKILTREKTIEIRKTIPKCELPINVYIYVTKEKPYLFKYFFNGDVWNYETSYCKEEFIDEEPTELNGKIIASFTLNKCNYISTLWFIKEDIQEDIKGSCLSNREFMNYVTNNRTKKRKNVYSWEIDDLKILDKPMELSDFGLKKAPQSWCYVEVKE